MNLLLGNLKPKFPIREKDVCKGRSFKYCWGTRLRVLWAFFAVCYRVRGWVDNRSEKATMEPWAQAGE